MPPSPREIRSNLLLSYDPNVFRQVTRHLRADHGMEPERRCEICGKLYKSNRSLKEHIMKIHRGEKPTCTLCGRKFYSKKSLEVHAAKHQKIFLMTFGQTAARDETSGRWKCGRCDKDFKLKASLKEHYSRHHLNMKPFQCSLCQKSLHSASALRLHQDIHTGTKRFPCKYCGRRFRRNKERQFHHNSHENAYPHSCRYCGKGFNVKTNHARHERLHVKRSTELLRDPNTGEMRAEEKTEIVQNLPVLSVKCRLCGTAFESHSGLRRHMTTHGEKAYKCDDCEATFVDIGNMNRHKRRVCGKRGNGSRGTLEGGVDSNGAREQNSGSTTNAICNNNDLNGKQDLGTSTDAFSDTLQLALTTRIGGLGDDVTVKKMFQCPDCDSVFGDSRNLARHRRIHTGEKPFRCRHCKTCFRQKNHLDRHERTHIKEKPFQCRHCDASFHHKHHLINHERTHTGEKPFQCQYCDSSFHQKTHLVRHERTHTVEKPFQCRHCDFSFSKKINLEKHEEIHAGQKLLKVHCQYCPTSFGSMSDLILHEKIHEGENIFQYQDSNVVEKIPLTKKQRDRRFHCPDCGAAFKKGSHLKEHIRIHTRPFRCLGCGSSFARSRALNTHAERCSDFIKQKQTHEGVKIISITSNLIDATE